MTYPYLVSCTIPPEHGGGITVSRACLVAIDGESEEDAMKRARVTLRGHHPSVPDEGFVDMKAERLGAPQN